MKIAFKFEQLICWWYFMVRLRFQELMLYSWHGGRGRPKLYSLCAWQHLFSDFRKASSTLAPRESVFDYLMLLWKSLDPHLVYGINQFCPMRCMRKTAKGLISK